MSAVAGVGRWVIFCGLSLRAVGQRLSWREVVEQMYVVGVRSVSTTAVTGAFVGAIMAIQIHLQVRDFGAEAFLGGLTASVTWRNVGPVLIGFILSGKVGAYTSAELGTLRVTDQIDALDCLGVDPIRYLVVPRLVAVVLSSFLLLVVGLMVSLGGGLSFAHLFLGVNSAQFLSNIPQVVTWPSLLLGVGKSLVFGFLIAAIACYRGYTARGGAPGVGRAVRGAAVTTLLAIIICDFLLSWVWAQCLTALEGWHG